MEGRYKQIAEIRLSPKRALVVSRYLIDGGYIIAQKKKEFKETGEEAEYFVPNAIIVPNVDGLQLIVNVLTEVIKNEKV